MNRTPSPLLIAAAAFASVAGASAEHRITGRVVLVGDPPAAAVIDPGPDACCQAAGPVEERLVVGPEGGLANVVVSIEMRLGERRPPAIDSPVGEPVTLTNLGCAFRPRVTVVRVGETLRLANDDPTMHNVAIDFVRNPAVNLVVEPDGERLLPLGKPERRPVPVRCNVHPFMGAWVVVRADGYAAVTDAAGRFSLPPPPAGDWRLRLWHEGEALSGIDVDGEATDRRGEVVLALADGEGRDVGEIAVDASRFRRAD